MFPTAILPLITLFLATSITRVFSTPALDSAVGSQFPISLTPVLDNHVRVPVLLGVMSRCPDALLCESVFDGVLKHTWDIVDISLSFIGKCVLLRVLTSPRCISSP